MELIIIMIIVGLVSFGMGKTYGKSLRPQGPKIRIDEYGNSPYIHLLKPGTYVLTRIDDDAALGGERDETAQAWEV